MKEQVKIRHYYKGKDNRLVATIVTKDVGEDGVLVAVSRCKNTDQPCKSVGRQMAISRLDQLEAHISGDLPPVAVDTFLKDKQNNLCLHMSRSEFLQAFIFSNPFGAKRYKKSL